jgi:hypothetical protein
VSKKLSTRILGEGDHEAWNRFVAQAPAGSPYANTQYLDVLCGAAGGRFSVLVAEQGGEIVGGIALYERPTRWGLRLEPRLLLQYNGFVLEAPRSRYPSENTARDVKILAALAEEIVRRDHAVRVIKSREPLSDGRVFGRFGWQVWPTYTYVVPLADLDRQWDLVERNLRRLIKRAEREGLSVSEDEDFDAFFHLHRETHRRKGAPLYLPEAAFREYFASLRRLGLCRLFHARTPDGRSVASQLVLVGAHPVSHTVSAAADAEMQQLGANPFLRWRSFELLAAAGSVANDLTDASLNPVTHFKSQLGGQLSTCLAAVAPRTRKVRAGLAAEKLARRVLSPLRKGG